MHYLDINFRVLLTFGLSFQTVTDTSSVCKSLGVPFPEVSVSAEDSATPKDFYIFKGSDEAPTVIHMPLFNTVNCGEFAFKLTW